MTILEKTPRDEGAAFVADSASVIGEVVLQPDANIWFGAVLRADVGPITVGRGTNVQDNAVVHCNNGGAVVLGEGVTVGHNAVLHGCTVGDHAMIGMGAVVMDGSIVGKNCIVAAGALVPAGTILPDNTLALGAPVKVFKPVTEQQIQMTAWNAAHYVELGRVYAAQQSENPVGGDDKLHKTYL